MKTQQISHVWKCTHCLQVSKIFHQESFKSLCLDLLAGKTGLMICPFCQQTDLVRFKDSTLELVVG